MSYCVNCGVELDKDAAKCPLCQTPVVNPVCPVDTTIPPNFPVERREVEPVNHREVAVLLSALYGVVGLCCVVLNLLFWWRGMPWSAIVAGACAMLWVWTVLPLLLRSAHSILLLGLDLLAKAAALLRIADGLDYRHLGNIQDVSVEVTDSTIRLQLRSCGECTPESARAVKKGDLLEHLTERTLECTCREA